MGPTPFIRIYDANTCNLQTHVLGIIFRDDGRKFRFSVQVSSVDNYVKEFKRSRRLGNKKYM